VVVNEAVGAPEAALVPFVAPIAPEPPVPVVSTPLIVTTVMDAATLWERVAVTEALVRTAGAKARQISAVPSCVLVRLTSDQVRLPPVTPVTVMPAVMASAEMNASSNSFAAAVVKVGDAMVVADELRSVETFWSIANCAVEVKFAVALAPFTVTAVVAGVKM